MVVVPHEEASDFAVSAFPSVVAVLPAKEVYVPLFDQDGGLIGVELTAEEEREIIIRMPSSWEVVADYLQYVA